MAHILVVYHSLGGNTKQMAEAVAKGAREAGQEASVKTGLEATVEDLLACDGVALGSPDYFSYMAGGLKDFLDRAFYPSQGKVTGKPCATFGSAGGPATTVLGVLDQAVRWFKFRKVGESVGASGGVTPGVLAECEALGRALAEAAKK